MNELAPTTTERKLWYEGPNYAADGVVFHPETEKVLLILRKSGVWALPGGFVDEGEQPIESAIREVAEETGITVTGDSPLVFRGVVDDPRNSEDSWIETSAYLFTTDSDTPPIAGDDAQDARWFAIDELPPLYASHDAILARALDQFDGEKLTAILSKPDSAIRIDAGHMEYNKSICEKDGVAVFSKQHEFEAFDTVDRANRSYFYLQKEAATMAHLRQNNFLHIPQQSALYGDTLVMNAFQGKYGWNWRAHSETITAYITDTLKVIQVLEQIPLPADSFPVEASLGSFLQEGWQSFDTTLQAKLDQRLEQFHSRLTDDSQITAAVMLADVSTLRHLALQSKAQSELVFCHHDLRQSNIAWHPEHGSAFVDWSWAGLGLKNSDSTNLLIDLHKSGHDIRPYTSYINPEHCLTLMGFWLAHSTWPTHRDDTVRFQQFLSAISAYEILQNL
jgi:ADP-ribose pyrophosphatase YjhB (NUDIX family)/aminoglycoside phosphotransferase